MLTLAKTAVLYARPEREMVARYAVPVYPFSADEMGRDEFETEPDGFREAYENKNAEPETFAAKLHREIMEREATKRAADDAKFAKHDWSTNPATWTREAVLYYLEFVCCECVSHESRTGTKEITAENLARAQYQFRKRNTETACATVPRADLLNAVKNAKKLNPRSPAKTVSLRINGSLDVITSDNGARFSQAVQYDKKAGDLRLTLPEQRLTAICSKLKSKTVELVLTSCEQLNEHVLTIKTESAEFTIPVELPNDSDKFASAFPAQFAHNVTAGELLRAFKMTEFATSTDSGRYALAGCFIQPGDDTLDIAATDSRRLSVETIPAELCGTMPQLERGETRHPLGVVVPPGIVSLLMDELKRQPSNAVVSFGVASPEYNRQQLFPPANLTEKQRAAWTPEELANVESNRNTKQSQDENGNWFQTVHRVEFVFEMPGAFSIRGIPVQGRFPRYLDVIPSSFESKYEIQRTAILEQCETILLSTDEESRGVEFVFPVSESDRNVRLAAKSATLGTASAIFHCESVDSTERRTIPLDPKYVIDYLKRSQAGFITIQIQDSETAILITADDSDGRYVQMPLSQDR